MLLLKKVLRLGGITLGEDCADFILFFEYGHARLAYRETVSLFNGERYFHDDQCVNFVTRDDGNTYFKHFKGRGFIDTALELTVVHEILNHAEEYLNNGGYVENLTYAPVKG